MIINRENILNLLIEVFESGLDEDSHFRNMEGLNLENLETQLQKCKNDSLEYILLSKLITDIKEKNKIYD